MPNLPNQLFRILCSSEANKIAQATEFAQAHSLNIPQLLEEYGYAGIGLCQESDFLATTLDCSNRNLSVLPALLPENLVELDCSNNQLQSLPNNLPPNLSHLFCAHNQLTQLPDDLPESLEEIICSHNQISQLPNYLPDALQEFDCSYNQLQALTEYLSNTIVALDCSYNQLTRLPDLHIWLEELNAKGNLFDCIIDLPENCQSDLPACSKHN